MEVDTVWDEALAYIEAKVPRPVFETWFIPLHFNGIDGSSVKLEVPSRYFGEWLGRHHRDLITEALSSAYRRDDPVAVEFVTSPKTAETRGSAVLAGQPLGDQGAPSSSRPRRTVHLNPKYTFGSFVVGASNQFAHATKLPNVYFGLR